jgi:hypothetical protein
MNNNHITMLKNSGNAKVANVTENDKRMLVIRCRDISNDISKDGVFWHW